MLDTISAINNPKVKEIRSLKDKKARYSLGKYIVEGVNIVKDIPDNVTFDLFYTEDRADFVSDFMYKARACYKVTDKVMQAMSDTITPSGVLAVADMRREEFTYSDVVLYLDGITDPGNMGTIIRTAVALGVKDIIAVSSVDVFSSKVIRSSMGGIFSTNIVQVDSDEALEYIKDYKVYSLDMNGENIFAKDFDIDNKRFVLAVGSEAHGLTSVMRERADRVLSLPMTDKMESLNAGVSMSTALYRILYL